MSRDHELDEELRFHLDQQIDQNLARGMTPDAARTAALVAMGGVERRKDEMRDTRRTEPLENLRRDLGYALRTLRRAPGYTAVALITLALGLGANTAIFTVVNAVLLRPLAYRDSGRLVAVDATVAAGTYLDWHAQQRSFEALGAAEWWSPTITGRGDPEQIDALHLTSDIMPMLGVAPLLGRVPSAEESHAGRHRVLVLSYGTWQKRFAGRANAVGQQLQLDGEPYTVIGVMPRDFNFAPYWATHSEMWAPLVLDARGTDRRGASMRVFGRLAPGIRLPAAQSELNALNARIDAEYPGTAGTDHFVPLQEMVVGDVRPALLVLFGAVGLVLLIACANVAHLQLLRAASRERETAVRVALGASRGRLLQQALVESTVLALGGAILGLGVAWAGLREVIALSPPSLPRVESIHLDLPVFFFLVAVSLAAGVLVGIAPALRGPGARPADALKEGSRAASESRGRRRLRSLLVISEIATALVLLVGAGLLVRSFVALQTLDPGFDPHHAIAFQVPLRGTAHEDQAHRGVFFAELEQRLRALPGVTAVGATNHLPIAGDNWTFSYSVEGRPFPRPGERPHALFRVARPGYFGAMRIPLARGRDFSTADEATNARVTIVNEALAAREWPGENPIGKRISVDDPAERADWFSVIGVARNVTQGRLKNVRTAEMYYPYMAGQPADSNRFVSALHPSELMFVVRATGDPALLARPVNDLVHAMDAQAPVSLFHTFEQLLATQFLEPTFYLLLLGCFAGTAIVLAAVGVYGVMSWSAARRTHEMGVRLALGASPDEPFRLVATEGMRLALAGGAAGLILALGLTRYLRTLLFGVQPTDPVMFVAAPIVLGAVALLACWIPARRASRIDPMSALRAD